ncbi:MAG: hypothetical protein ACD_71C00190G0003 [uncultured bacterium (gcode 4)]|uniref:Fido domain-containing protein n=1 Tax=uncultured bacterium (gcode 4) TaxID=1234023 RepID=K2A2P2_9BACT|nr:MAG: hypothetical protein ACD_71C00190G0003 [uncultured bacterium (gcode 4)]
MFDQIKLIVVNAYRHYLEEVLAKNLPEKHEQIRAMFDTHMGHIAQYCIDNYMNKSELTIPFIKGLHKIFFPKGYTQTKKTIEGLVIVSMIPGQYKTLDNAGVNYINPDEEVVLTAPVEVKESMKWLISNFNFSIKQEADKQTKQDTILYFILDFLYIHPFGDANGRVACILTDIILVKYGLSPIYFYLIKEKNLEGLYRAVQLSVTTRDLKYLYEVIEKYSD